MVGRRGRPARLRRVAWLAYAQLRRARPRRDALIALRFLTLVRLVVFLMRPVRTTDEGLRDAVVPVLVDVSRSMSIDDAGDGSDRIDRARDLLDARSAAGAAAGHFQVEVLSFGDRVATATPEPRRDGPATAICRRALPAVRDRYRGRPVPGSFSSRTAATRVSAPRPADPARLRDRRRIARRSARDREVLERHGGRGRLRRLASRPRGLGGQPRHTASIRLRCSCSRTASRSTCGA